MDAGTADFATDSVNTEFFATRLAKLHGLSESSVDIDPSVPKRFVGDRRRLSQALGNIIENAGNYAGGATRLHVSSPAAGWIRFCVEDRGRGVPESERDAIFGRFARGTAGRRAGASTGTGLGLALVAEHVRLHGGTVVVEDNPGGGARFVVDIPVGASDAD